MARIYIEKINAYIDDESKDIRDSSTNETVSQKEYEKRMIEWMERNKKDLNDNQ